MQSILQSDIVIISTKGVLIPYQGEEQIMSANKFRYYEVSNTAIVKANNMTDAQALVRGRKNVTGQILATDVDVTRLSASEAQSFISE